MPLILKKDTPSGWIALWEITETTEQLSATLPAEDTSCEGINNPARASQRLAWRAALRELLPGGYSIIYNGVGAPVLDGIEGYIGVSHCKGYAAVIYNRCAKCALDIEEYGRDFSKAAPRYISSREAALPCAAEEWFKAVVWCAKEAMYKLSGMKELDFLYDIKVDEVSRDRVIGNVKGIRARLAVLETAGICIVYTPAM